MAKKKSSCETFQQDLTSMLGGSDPEPSPPAEIDPPQASEEQDDK